MNKKSNKISNFEEDLKKLQSILDDIESDKLTLEDSIKKYKEGWKNMHKESILEPARYSQ